MQLILTPLKKEQKELINSIRVLLTKESIQKLSTFNGIDIYSIQQKFLCATSGHGKSQSALQSQYLLNQIENHLNISISSLISCGTAGALVPNLTLPHLVVATETIEYDFLEKLSTSSFPKFPADTNLLEQIKTINFSSLTFAPIASGDQDVIDENTAQEIIKLTNASAVAWEGSGVARTARFNRLPFLEVRSPTDHSNIDSKNDFLKNLRTSMDLLAKFFIQLHRL